MPTASGDSESYIRRFFEAFPDERAEASYLSLFQRILPDLQALDLPDMRAQVLAQDVIYVGGGSTVNLLAVWRAHGLDVVLREAWEAGIVLCGVSAGALCWFAGGSTDSFGPLAPLQDGLGFLPGSVCPHYDGEAERWPAFRQFVEEGLPGGYGVDDSAALYFAGTQLVEAIASVPTARAHRVERQGNSVVETPLSTRFLGSV